MDQIKGMKSMDFLPLQLRQDVKKWHSSNPNAYKKFYKLFERMRESDFTFVKKLFAFVEDCVPTEFVDAMKYMKDTLDDSKWEGLLEPYLVENFGAYIDKCYEGSHSLVIDIVTKEVLCVANSSLKEVVKENTLLFNSYIFNTITTLISKRCKAFINSLFEEWIRSAYVVKDEERDEFVKVFKELAKVFLYYSLAFVAICSPKLICNCKNKSTSHYNLSFCLLYFLIFDNGMTKFTKVLIDNFNSIDTLGPEYHFLKEQTVKCAVNASVSKGYETKDSWKKMAGEQKDVDDEDSINNALSHVKRKRGRKPSNQMLEELLIGDTPNLLRNLDTFIDDQENKTIDLACMFRILELTSHIKCGYETFHEAISAYAGKGRFGVVSAPQTQYKELFNKDRALYDQKYYDTHKELHGKKWKRMRALYERWHPIFKGISSVE